MGEAIEGVELCCAGAGGDYDWADLYCETTGYGFAFQASSRRGLGNGDLADDAEEAG